VRKTYYLDTNLFIYHFEDNPSFVAAIDRVFSKLANKSTKGVTSIITLAEILSLKSLGPIVESIKKSLLSTPNLVIVDVNQEIAEEAARIRRKYGFRLPDSLHLATALHEKADYFVTGDKQIKKIKEIKIKLLTPHLFR